MPDSVVETQPQATVVIIVSPESVVVQGEAVARTREVLKSKEETVAAIRARLSAIERNIIGIGARIAAESREVLLFADRTIPFSVLRKIMSTCTASGYGRISLAATPRPTS